MITINDIELKDNMTKEQIENDSYLSRAIPKLLGNLNLLIDREKGNYTVKMIECKIGYGQPIKITVWVTDIKDRVKFYDMEEGQNKLHLKYCAIDWFSPTEHIIDVREF